VRLFGDISDSIGEIFTKIHTSHPPHMRCKWLKFGRDQSLIKDTLLGEQGIISSRLCVDLRRREFLENLYLAVSTRALHVV
jgi:hypothetical protein